MSKTKGTWVVTDLDGTLLDHNYDLSPALDTLNNLRRLEIPVIPCTSKTASEVRILRAKIGSKDPFIVENGGAIYGNKSNSSEEWELILGRSYDELRPLLDSLSDEIGCTLIALNDLKDDEIIKLTGLDLLSIKPATSRQWSVPFLNPPESSKTKLLNASEKLGLTVLQGNRMSHLIGQGSHKGRAVVELKNFLNQKDVNIIALGDSPNDMPLLEIADQAIVVPGKNGPHPIFLDKINSGNFLLAPDPHAVGWSKSVNKQLGLERY